MGKPVSNGLLTAFIICIVDEENEWVVPCSLKKTDEQHRSPRDLS